MKQLIVATKNAGKAKEFQTMFASLGIETLSLLDLEQAPDVEETGITFEENAKLKAEAIAKAYNVPVIADDSGLEIEALHGEPGVFSARYAGMDKSDEKNIDKVLEKMRGVADGHRKARFVCALAVARPGKETIIVEGYCNGHIGYERKGNNGFGYDPIFMINDTTSMAELSKDEKNAISHRRDALNQLERQVRALF
ncbi:Nucleoside-triphosphatase rdgB [Fictibacillus macauensis ZFHKF-1]|uniref:dITP/XTP pyrophosphatase n=1 Tax=Fictibacillus macauensis ZFHKF-1 TaxID=1196324 RepID=I8J0V9_9BACL|nr:XTP/dITP diphosphatase [Fictibacillus macauensis]EIT85391.1 Nucleoside-triphosphatase rdgB [Fictibacillus macauensis ZFHKF-1]